MVVVAPLEEAFRAEPEKLRIDGKRHICASAFDKI
jgi:hypothetical protein